MYGCQGRKGERDELGDWNWHIYTNDTMYKTEKGEDTYITDDSLCWAAATNTPS